MKIYNPPASDNEGEPLSTLVEWHSSNIMSQAVPHPPLIFKQCKNCSPPISGMTLNNEMCLQSI